MLNNNEVIAFAHVPKCGGKSFKKGLESAYGEDMVSYYVNPLRHRAKDALDFHLWRIKKSLFPKRYALDAKIISWVSHRWGFAKPLVTFGKSHHHIPELCLTLAGDGFGGERVERAAISGLDAADAILGTKL